MDYRAKRRFVEPGWWAWFLSLGLLAWTAVACREGLEERVEARGVLPRETLLRAEIAPGETHSYTLPQAPEGIDPSRAWYLHIAVMQKGTDVELRLLDAGGETVVTADRPISDWGEEWLSATLTAPGTARLEVFAFPSERPTGRYELELEILRPATDADLLEARAFRAYAVGRKGGPEAEDAYREALALWQETGNLRGQGEVLWHLGFWLWQQKEWKPAEETFLQSVELFQRATDPLSEALARNALASLFLDRTKTGRAAEQYRIILELTAAGEDRIRRGTALHGLGQAQRHRGNIQAALDLFNEARALWADHEADPRARTLHQLGVLHLFNLHSPERALPYFEAALAAWPEEPNSERDSTLNQLGQLHLDRAQPQQARRYLDQALKLRGEKPCSRARTLAKLAVAEEREGRPRQALGRLEEAAAIVAGQDCPWAATTVCMHRGSVLLEQGDAAGAAEFFTACWDIYRARENRAGIAVAATGLGRARQELGEVERASEAARRAVAIYRELRPQVDREDLRTSFFAGAQGAYDLLIELLWAQGDFETAFEFAEEAKARSLRDRLSEAGAGIHRGADPKLLSLERELQIELAEVERKRYRRSRDSPDLISRRDALIARLEQVRGRIRRESPQYARLTRPPKLSLDSLQDSLGEEEALLEFRLGDRQSHLWWVTRDTVKSFLLPPRAEIEPRIETARRLLRSLDWPGFPPPALCQLSQRLLGPIAEELGNRNLILVPDGALHGLPMAALPLPTEDCSRHRPLIQSNSLIVLPSATVLTDLRRERETPPSPKRLLAVIGDPLYQASGPGADFRRLRYSAAEAKAIAALVPPELSFLALGEDARREVILDGNLADFRILHFAVHGILDPRQPLLSHLVFSTRDRQGRPRDGRLYAHEIYNLDLSAELVVLSACDTGSGRQLAGEGMVSGLLRGFLYAGARRLLVSLWPVDDAGTAELMIHFYRGLFEGSLPPAEALRQAQQALAETGAPPYLWAGFVLQGDPTPLPSVPIG